MLQRKNAGSEYYDTSDPFIDDSELALDERQYFAQTKQQGFYVSSGEVALMKDKYVSSILYRCCEAAHTAYLGVAGGPLSGLHILYKTRLVFPATCSAGHCHWWIYAILKVSGRFNGLSHHLLREL